MNAPKQPSPAQQAAAQSNINNQTAQLNQAYGLTDQSGPYGTLTNKQTGTRIIPAVYRTNKKGKQVLVTPSQEVPVYTQSVELSPGQQALLGQQEQFGLKSTQLGNEQLGRLSELLGHPLDLSNDAVTGYITDLYAKRLDPVWNERQQQLETELRNQGLQPGTKGYDAAMRDFNVGRNDAYDQILRSARGQSVQEILTARNQPINETTALMSGGQVNLPQFANIGGPSVSGVDFAAMNANNYNQKNAQYNAMLGGLAGLGSAAVQSVGPYALRGYQNPGAPAAGGSGGWTYGSSGQPAF